MQAKKFFSLIAVLLALAFVVQSYAADSSNVAVNIQETHYGVTYYGTFTFLGTGTDSRFSKAFNITGLDLDNAVFTVYGNAVSNIDVDLSYHYSFDRLGRTDVDGVPDSLEFDLFTEVQDTDIQQKGAAAETNVLSDSVGTVAERKFYKRARWLMIEGDGQTGNPTTAQIYWSFYLPKKAQDVIGRMGALGNTGIVKPTN